MSEDVKDAVSSDSEEEKQGGTTDTVPYERFKEVIDQLNESKTETSVLKSQIDQINARLSAPQVDDISEPEYLDPETKAYFEKKMAQLQRAVDDKVNNIAYEQEKKYITSTTPELKGKEREIDQYCIEYKNKWGYPISLEAAAEVVKSRYKAAPKKKEKPAEEKPKEAKQDAPVATDGGSVVNLENITDEQLEDVLL